MNMEAHHLRYPSEVVEILKDAASGKLIHEEKVRTLAENGFLEIPQNRDVRVDENNMTLDFKITKFGKMIIKENIS